MFGRRRPHLLVAAAVCVVLVLVAAFGVRTFVVRPFHIPSASMAPTVQPGDVVLVDRTARGTAERGELVVFDGRGYFEPTTGEGQEGADGAVGGRFWLKRVIAIGGDRVTCCGADGRITVNGEPIGEPYLAAGVAPSEITFDLEVPEGRVFVLGDNRADSTDSRHLLGAPGGGMIPVERVMGRADRVVWPLSRAGEL